MSFENVTYRGIELRCDYVYAKGLPASHRAPAEPESAYLRAVQVEGVNVLPLLSSQARDGIEQACIARHHELRDEAWIDAHTSRMEG